MADFDFRFCLNTSTIRSGEISIVEKIDVAAEAGYDGIEPWVAEMDAHVAAGGNLGDLALKVRDAGLEIVNLIGFFEWAVDDEAKRGDALEEAKRCFDIARQLNCRFVAAPPSGIKDTPGVDLFAIAERYAQVIGVAKEFGVVPLLEFWGVAKTIGRLGEALLVASECGRDEACILADVFHMYKGSGHFGGLELIGPQTLGLVHINDYPTEPPRSTIADSDRVYPGDGVAPLKRILSRLAQVGYRGMLSLELFNQSYWEQDAASVARTGLAKTRAAVETAISMA